MRYLLLSRINVNGEKKKKLNEQTKAEKEEEDHSFKSYSKLTESNRKIQEKFVLCAVEQRANLFFHSLSFF